MFALTMIRIFTVKSVRSEMEATRGLALDYEGYYERNYQITHLKGFGTLIIRIMFNVDIAHIDLLDLTTFLVSEQYFYVMG